MTQDEMWKARCDEYAAFIETNGRCPSKHFPEERNLHSWWKHNRKLINANAMRADRVERFKELVALAESHRHVNQYQ